MIYVTGDHHFNHDNIIEYAERPFKNAREMNYELIKRYQKKVKKEDTVYFVGDFSLEGPEFKLWYKKILNQLPGTKILILGSHDQLDPFTYEDVGFQTVHTWFPLEYNGTTYYLRHDPAASIMAQDKIWLCAHIHTLFRKQKNVVNVGVDVWDFYPAAMDEVEFRYHDPEGIWGIK